MAFQNQHGPSRNVEACAAASMAMPWMEALRTPILRQEVAAATAPRRTLRQYLVETESYQAFLKALRHQAYLHDDWLDITSRPFIQGPVDALLGNPFLARVIAADQDLRGDVEAIVANIDAALRKGHGLPWLVGIVAALAHFPGIHQLVEVADRGIKNDAIARFEARVAKKIDSTSVSDMRREARLVRAVLSPMVLDMALRLATSLITAERVLWLVTIADDALTSADTLTLLSRDSVDDSK